MEIGKAVNRAMEEGIVARSDLFLANKISDEGDAGFDKATALVMAQLNRAGLE